MGMSFLLPEIESEWDSLAPITDRPEFVLTPQLDDFRTNHVRDQAEQLCRLFSFLDSEYELISKEGVGLCTYYTWGSTEYVDVADEDLVKQGLTKAQMFRWNLYEKQQKNNNESDGN